VDDILDDLVRCARRCERAARRFDAESVAELIDRLRDAIESVGQAWSGSWIGWQATVYTAGLRPRNPGEHFDTEWGSLRVARTTGEWCEYAYEAVRDEIDRRAGTEDFSAIEEAAQSAKDAFNLVKEQVLPTFDALLSTGDDPVVRELREKVSDLRSHLSRQDFASAQAPRKVFTRDPRAMQGGGLQIPHHIQVEAWLLEQISCGTQTKELAKLIRHAERYLQQSRKMKGRTVAKTDGKVFIGHGRSQAWRDLKDFIAERLQLDWDEFNREPTAGLATPERLADMLDDACFAFLVLTAEDEHHDGTIHARENVIHEVGLFQGRLGFRRAIVLLEDGCAEFSNIHGLTQIRFPKGDIRAKSEEIRRVLEREGIIGV